jgi:hypothetical protein
VNRIDHPRTWNAIDNEKQICVAKAGHAKQRGLSRITIQALDQAGQTQSDHECGIRPDAKQAGVDRRKHIAASAVDHAGKTGCSPQADAAWPAGLGLAVVSRVGEKPCFLIRDNDGKYGQYFNHVTPDRGIEVLRTPGRAPKANAMCERFIGSVRRECLDQMLILNERHLHRMIGEYVGYFNTRDRIRGSANASRTRAKLTHAEWGRGVGALSVAGC